MSFLLLFILMQPFQLHHIPRLDYCWHSSKQLSPPLVLRLLISHFQLYAGVRCRCGSESGTHVRECRWTLETSCCIQSCFYVRGFQLLPPNIVTYSSILASAWAVGNAVGPQGITQILTRSYHFWTLSNSVPSSRCSSIHQSIYRTHHYLWVSFYLLSILIFILHWYSSTSTEFRS